MLGLFLSVFAAFFCIATGGVIYKRRLAKRRFDVLNKQCHDSLITFSKICTCRRIFSDAERDHFVDEYKDLWQQCKQIAGSVFIKRVINNSDLGRLLKVMEELPKRQKENNDTYFLIQEINTAVATPIMELQKRKGAFFNYSFVQNYLQRYGPLYQKIPNKPTNPLQTEMSQVLSEEVKSFSSTYSLLLQNDFRDGLNDKYMKQMLEVHGSFFDTVVDYPLDEQQRYAIVDLEDNVLVVASAGSGKTSTIVGKANYLVKKLGVAPANILIVTYTKKAAAELQQRINIPNIEATTFHAHAFATIGKIAGTLPNIMEEGLLERLFVHRLDNDQKFKSWFIKYETLFQNLMKADFFQYEKASEYIADLKKYGKKSPYTDKDGEIRFLKSNQEMQIFNYLTELGLQIKYEHPYEIKTVDKKHKQYLPDFTIFYEAADGEGNKRLYLEHFGIDKDGNVPKWFGDGQNGGWDMANYKYNEEIKWKKRTHKQNKTQFAYTTSAMFTDGSIYQEIDAILKRFKIPVKPLSNDEKIAKLSRGLDVLKADMQKFLSSFINLMKATQTTIEDILQKLPPNDNFYQRNREVLLNIIKPIYEDYETFLQDNGQIDFADMLYRAAELNNDKTPYNFDYILVDEFQDMSKDKYVYLQSLRRPSRANPTRLFCVGDDWQSIYRFAGNDMALFFDFEKFFGYTSTRKIETTHRFGEPLITQSSNFILKNPIQQHKIVHSDSEKRRTDIKFIPYKKEEEQLKKLEDLIEKLPQESKISIIARYNYDIEQMFPDIRCYDNNKYPDLKIKNRTVKFLTVHSAKGLEADYVILVRCRGGKHGFPSLITDDPLMKYVLSAADSFENAEERRVFYVAITRAKRCTFVLYDATHCSVFVDEFIKTHTSHDKCPRCQTGGLIYKDGIASNGNYYASMRCDNPYCDYRELVFFKEEEVKVYPLKTYLLRWFGDASYKQEMIVTEGEKYRWCFSADVKSQKQYPTLALDLTPKLENPASVHEMVVVECKQGSIIRKFASDSSLDTPQMA